MESVFPEGLGKYDIEGIDSLEKVQNVLRKIVEDLGYIDERVSFSFHLTNKSVSEAGVSSVTVVDELNEVKSNISAVSSRVAGVEASLRSLGGEITSIQHDNQTILATFATMSETIDTINQSITSLNNRVTALEH